MGRHTCAYFSRNRKGITHVVISDENRDDRPPFS